VRRVRVGGFVDMRAARAGIEAIEETRQENRAGTVETLQVREIDLYRAAATELWLRRRHRPYCAQGMGQIERPRRRDTGMSSVSLHSDFDPHAPSRTIPTGSTSSLILFVILACAGPSVERTNARHRNCGWRGSRRPHHTTMAERRGHAISVLPS
jgi:hypothetical protein